MAKRKAKQKRRKPRNLYQLDIVIPVYGQPGLLEKCLASIDETIGDIKARIIVVDDQGPEQDKLQTIYQSLNGAHRIIRNPENQGFPATVNRGVQAGNAPLVLLLNSDVVLKPGCLQAMLATFEADEKTAVVGAKLLFPEDSSDPQRPAGKVQHAGIAVRFNGQIVHANISWSADHPASNEERVMQAVTGACLMTRRSVWREVVQLYRQAGDTTSGAINEVYSPGTYEDIEYCFAARQLGYQVVYQPKAEAYHLVGGSSAMIGKGYPLGRNENIFRARCGAMLDWDEWKYV